MAYVKHTWIDGEVITAEKLCCIENGIDCLANCRAVWTNHEPTASFAAQTLALDTSTARTLDFCFVTEDEGQWQNVFFTLTKLRAYAVGGAYHFRVSYGNYERFVTVDDEKIVFSDCKYGISYNEKLIPYSIHALD